ncbi:MAG: histidinol-phosphate transaminase [Planctomycetia bacterium]
MDYFRPNVTAMAGYTPGEQPQTTDWVKLNTNENPYPPSPRVFEAIQAAATDRLRLYPDPLARRFRQAVGQVLGVDPDGVVACNGSDDALTILARSCLDAADLLVAPTPSYPLYRVLAQIQGCRYEERPFQADGRLPERFTTGAKLAIVPNPNSPTGSFLPPASLLEQAEAATGLFVADEAYAAFAPADCVGLVARCERLVVTRTMSKSHGLAGIRFGYLVAQPRIADVFLKVKDSYNCDALSIAAATAAILDEDYYRSVADKIRVTRARMEKETADLGFTVEPSHANFVWIRRKEPVEPIYLGLKERKILVRLLRYPNYGEGLRLTVGTDAEVDVLLAELRRLV